MISRALAFTGGGKVLVTDRLQATVFATMIDMPVFTVDQYYGKINRMREVLFDEVAECMPRYATRAIFPSLEAHAFAELHALSIPSLNAALVCRAGTARRSSPHSMRPSLPR